MTVADNSSTFLMTNMIPQAPDNNQQTWANLETYARTLANSGSELYVVSGGQGKTGFIANGHVAVPAYTWKVIMVLPTGTNDVSRVTTSTRLIAVWMPNQNGISTDWRSFTSQRRLRRIDDRLRFFLERARHHRIANRIGG